MAIKIGVGSGGQDFDEVDLKGKTLVVRFCGVRHQDAGLLTKEYFDKWNYEDRDGQIVRKKTDKRPEKILAPGQELEAYFQKIFWKFTVVAPAEFADVEVPYSCKLAGIRVADEEYVEFVTESDRNLSGLISTAIACGFRPGAVNSKSPTFDQDYTMKILGQLSYPVSREEVVLALEHVLLEAAADGHLVEARTKDDSNWLKTYSFKSLNPQEADDIRAKAQSPAPELVDESEEDSIPFDRAPYEDQIRAAVREETITPAALVEFLKGRGFQYDKKRLLASLSDEALVKVSEWLEADEDEVSL